MHVATDAGRLAADHHGDLGMGFQTDDAVDHMDPDLLQRLRPGDVGLFVTARLQLDQGHHLLAALSRPDQGAHDRADRSRGSVERLLDRQHLPVLGGLVDERLRRGGKGVIGMMHQDIALGKHGEEIGRLAVNALQAPLRYRGPGLVLEVGPIKRINRPEVTEVEQPRQAIDITRTQVELGDQQAKYLARHRFIDLEPYHARLSLLAAELTLDRFQQVGGFIVDEIEVRVPRDPERVVPRHLHAGKEGIEVERDHLLERYVPSLAG